MTSYPSRRKFVTITAAAAGMGLLPFGLARADDHATMVEWQGVSLGSVATIRLYHPDREAGRRLIERVVAEARRLEMIFTLYETNSVLCDLNRRGVLVAPPAELVDVLQQCDRAWHVTGGVFDPTVQPLWNCYYKHFAEVGETSPPSAEKLAQSLQLVGWPKVKLSRDQIVFEKPGMALTLNGIAQGYITDRVVDLLRRRVLQAASSTWAKFVPSARMPTASLGTQRCKGRSIPRSSRPRSTSSTKRLRHRPPADFNSINPDSRTTSSIR